MISAELGRRIQRDSSAAKSRLLKCVFLVILTLICYNWLELLLRITFAVYCWEARHWGLQKLQNSRMCLDKHDCYVYSNQMLQ